MKAVDIHHSMKWINEYWWAHTIDYVVILFVCSALLSGVVFLYIPIQFSCCRVFTFKRWAKSNYNERMKIIKKKKKDTKSWMKSWMSQIWSYMYEQMNGRHFGIDKWIYIRVFTNFVWWWEHIKRERQCLIFSTWPFFRGFPFSYFLHRIGIRLPMISFTKLLHTHTYRAFTMLSNMILSPFFFFFFISHVCGGENYDTCVYKMTNTYIDWHCWYFGIFANMDFNM